MSTSDLHMISFQASDPVQYWQALAIQALDWDEAAVFGLHAPVFAANCSVQARCWCKHSALERAVVGCSRALMKKTRVSKREINSVGWLWIDIIFGSNEREIFSVVVAVSCRTEEKINCERCEQSVIFCFERR